MSFAERFKELRTKRGLTQENMAEKLGVSRVSISKYETPGEKGTTPDYEKLLLIADLFNVTTDYLLGREEAAKHYFTKEDIEPEDQALLKKFLAESEALIRLKGSITEEKIKSVLRFMEFTYLEDLAEEEQNKKRS